MIHKKGWSITPISACVNLPKKKKKMRWKEMILLVIMENSNYDPMRGCLEEDLKQYNVFQVRVLCTGLMIMELETKHWFCRQVLLSPIPSSDLGIDFNETPPVMHTESPSYTIGHIDHGSLPPTSSISPTLAMDSPYTESMSFMPTPGLHIDPMSMDLTHISSTTSSSPVVVGFSIVGREVE